MAATNSSSSYKLQTLATFLCRYRAMSGGSLRSHHDVPRCKVVGGGSFDQGLRLPGVTSKLEMETNQTKEVQLPPEMPAPMFGFSNWVRWVVGSVVIFLLPFWKSKRDNLLMLEGKAAKVVGEVEVVAEVVEKVATTADTALEEVANELPDNSKLKEAAQVLQHACSVAAHDAQFVEDVINKVSDVRKDLEDLDTVVEPIVDKIIQGKRTARCP